MFEDICDLKPSPPPKLTQRLLDAAPSQDSAPESQSSLLMLGSSKLTGKPRFAFERGIYAVNDTQALEQLIDDIPASQPRRTLQTLKAAQRATRQADDVESGPRKRFCPTTLPEAKSAAPMDPRAMLAALAREDSMDSLPSTPMKSPTPLTVQDVKNGQVDFSMGSSIYRTSEETFQSMQSFTPPPKPKTLAELKAMQKARAARCKSPSAHWPSMPLAMPSPSPSKKSAMEVAILNVKRGLAKELEF